MLRPEGSAGPDESLLRLRAEAAGALRWSSAAQLSQQLVQLGASIALARLLPPVDFGVFGMAAVLAGFAVVVADLGLGAAVTREPRDEPGGAATAFVVSLAAAAAMGCLLLLAGAWASRFFGEPAVGALTALLAVGVVLSGAGGVPRALLVRRLALRELAVVDLISLLCGAAVGCALALRGHGAMSLAWQSVTTSAIALVLLVARREARPSLLARRAAVRDLARFGLPLTGYNALNYWARNGDNLLVGRFLGASPLGVYARAYGLMLLPVQMLTNAVGRVMFPVLSRLSSDRTALKGEYLRALRLVSFVALPTMAWLAVAADRLVPGVYGPQWQAVVPVMRVLCALGAVQALGATTGWIFQATGRTDVQLSWALLASTTCLAAIAVGVGLGSVLAVATCYAVTSGVLLFYPAFAIPGRLIGLRVGEVLGAAAAPAACTLLMAAVTFPAGLLLPAGTSDLAALAAEGVVGGVAYLAAARALCRPELGAALALLPLRHGGGRR